MGRRHGCERPFNVPQVACAIMYFLLLCGFYVLTLPTLPAVWETAFCTVLYTVDMLIVASLFIRTSLSDPSDYGTDAEQLKSDEERYFCTLCQIHVGKNSKHCRSCDRCVHEFDHHCKWLNNCVGGNNYNSFFWLVTTTCMLVFIQFGTGMYLFGLTFVEPNIMALKIADVYGGGLQVTGFRVLQAVYGFLCIPPAILLGELLMFHILLKYKGMSTYDYIMAQREAKTALQEQAPSAKPWHLQIFKVGGADSNANTPKRLKVGLSPLALLKMDRTSRIGDSSGCGCGSPLRGKNTTAHLHPPETPSSPGTQPLLPGTPYTGGYLTGSGLERDDSLPNPKNLFPHEKEDLVQSASGTGSPSMDLSRLAVVSTNVQSDLNLKGSLPPISPAKSKLGK